MWPALQFYPQPSGFSTREGSGRRRGARRRGQRREWEEFEVLDAGMKKFPLKLLAAWVAAAIGWRLHKVESQPGTLPFCSAPNRHALSLSKRGARVK